MYLFWMLSQDNRYFLLVQNYFRYLVKYWQQKYDEKRKTITAIVKSNTIVKKTPNQLQK